MRYPSAAGTFYSTDKKEIKSEIEGYLTAAEKDMEEASKKEDILKELLEFRYQLGFIVPHAGHAYSGHVAAYAYSLMKKLPKNTSFIIIGPNHTGRGGMIALSQEDWETPLGTVKNDRELGDLIRRNSNIVDYDETAHAFEHSIEVQLPFLQLISQTTSKNLRVVEISMGMQDYEFAEDLSNAINRATKDIERPVVVIASSDMTHFEPAENAERKDKEALSLIEELNSDGFFSFVRSRNLSICGYGPITTLMLFASKNNGKSKLLKYANSGDVTGDYSSVVGYASIAFYK